MRNLIEHIIDEVIENAFAGTNFGRTDFRVILAEVILKTNCSYHCGHTATSIAAGLGLITSRNRTMSGFDAGWKSTKAGHEFAIDAYYTNRPGSVVRQLKDAEARIAELTADLDKESEIRHRIHEELNAIKGEQQPVAYMHRSGQVVTREECSNDKIFSICCKVETPLYIHPAPAVLPPEIVRDDADGYWLYKGGRVSSANAAYYNQALRDAKALGAKPLPVVELPNLASIHENWGEDYMLKSDVIDMLKAAGVKCEEKS